MGENQLLLICNRLVFGAIDFSVWEESTNGGQLYEKFKPGKTPDESLGRSRDWCVDLIPKFLMANGELTNILVHTNVTRYVEFKQIEGSFVYRYGKPSKVPATEYEAIASSLIGIFEKRRLRNFLQFVASYNDDEVSTHKGLNLDKNTTDEVFNKFGLEAGTKNFIGHAMALYDNDDYLQQPARSSIERIILYVQSVAKYGKSPYLYPLYGLGELPQGFSRLSAIYGGTFMLGTQVKEILYEDDDDSNDKEEKEGDKKTKRVSGIKIELDGKIETVKSKVIIADPTYFPEKVNKTKKLIRTISILNSLPLKNGENSAQIILPGKEINRKNDIYIALIGSEHKVCPPNKFVSIVSTIIDEEQNTPPHLQLEAAFKLLNITSFEHTFMGLSEIFEPIDDGSNDGVFISKSYDATSHFESVTEDIKDLYFRVTGNPLKLTKLDQGEFNAVA